jgi:hypothetical protein
MFNTEQRPLMGGEQVGGCDTVVLLKGHPLERRTMAIGAVTQTLIGLLEAGVGDAAWPVKAMSSTEAAVVVGPHVGLLLWRVEPDAALRSLMPQAGAQRPSQDPAVVLHYLVFVGGGETTAAQDVLGRCVRALITTPVLSGAALAPDQVWPAGTVLQVGAEVIDNPTLLALWQAMRLPLQSGANYEIKGLRLA